MVDMKKFELLTDMFGRVSGKDYHPCAEWTPKGTKIKKYKNGLARSHKQAYHDVQERELHARIHHHPKGRYRVRVHVYLITNSSI